MNYSMEETEDGGWEYQIESDDREIRSELYQFGATVVAVDKYLEEGQVKAVYRYVLPPNETGGEDNVEQFIRGYYGEMTESEFDVDWRASVKEFNTMVEFKNKVDE